MRALPDRLGSNAAIDVVIGSIRVRLPRGTPQMREQFEPTNAQHERAEAVGASSSDRPPFRAERR